MNDEPGGEGAKHWLHILTEIKNRGVSDVLMLVCDGLKGLPEVVENVWPLAVVQTFERGFQHVPGEQLQQTVRAGQRQPSRLRLGHHRRRGGLLRRQLPPSLRHALR